MDTREIIKREPIDIVAWRVTRRGVRYESGKIIQTADSETPLPTRSCRDIDLAGERRGRLVVIGLSATTKGRWVCRCDCGMYTLRTAKAIKNEKNFDRCEECRQLDYLKRHDEFLRTGANSKIGAFDKS